MEKGRSALLICSIYLYLVRYACYAMPLLFIRYLEVKTPLHTHEFLYCTFIYIHHFLHTVKVCSNFSEPLNKVTQNFMGQNIQLIQYTLLEKTLGCFASR